MADINWSHLHKCRSEVGRRYRSIWTLPIASRYSDVLLKADVQPEALLEIGAGGRGLLSKVRDRWSNCRYASFDIDRSVKHDFYELSEITGEYDIVCMFEVIEHVTPQLALDMLQKSYEVLKPGGLLMVTTPNIFYPPGFLRDATHITPWCYDELGGLAVMAGFEVQQLLRLYKESLIKQLFRRYLGYPFFRLVRIDYSKQLMLVAKKNA